MTQRIQSPAHAVWRWGYIAICLLAIAAAGAIARGEVANAELRLVAVAVKWWS
jgi:hypothetical protein